jgi:hypothetical protein
MHVPINNDRKISTGFDELHDLLSFSRHRCPSRLGFRILFQPAQTLSVKTKIDLFQASTRSALYCVTLPFNFDRLRVFDQALIPDLDKSVLKGFHWNPPQLVALERFIGAE